SNLERFMYRTPHDSLGSWNSKTMYSTEKRFWFRHLPWFPGAVTPICITAHDEIAKNYTRDGQIVTVPFLKTRTAAHIY
ncbi:hypothetical protein EC988_005918, partial [Linderina pennispora]